MQKMQENNLNLPTLSHKEMLKIDKDYQQAAQIAALVYVSDTLPGIQRVKKGKDFLFVYKEKPLKDDNEISRIKKLAVPPAWSEVWICPLPNGHIQATGKDLRQRKQYRYHNLWHELRNETKFHRLYEFGKVMPKLRLQLEKDLSLKDLCEEKVLAAVISLMERTYIRIGNSGYEKLYGSYGLTTLKDKHVKFQGASVDFEFKGKKGIYHKVSLKNKKLAKIIKECRDIPGKELFQYYDEKGVRKSIDSGMVNNYIKEATGGDFTAKDFRTWSGTLNVLRSFKSIGEAINDSDKKKKVLQALDEVSMKLGNTRTVCKKYYVHPGIIRLYEEDNLKKYLKELDKLEVDDNTSDLTAEEKVLMKVLKNLQSPAIKKAV